MALLPDGLAIRSLALTAASYYEAPTEGAGCDGERANSTCSVVRRFCEGNRGCSGGWKEMRVRFPLPARRDGVRTNSERVSENEVPREFLNDVSVQAQSKMNSSRFGVCTKLLN